MSGGEGARAARLLAAQVKAAELFDAVGSRGLIAPGVTERQASDAVRDLAGEMFGIRRYWHKRIIRAGPNTLQPMLTNPEAASAAGAGIARYETQIARAIPAGDAGLRAAIISAITLGITVSRHLVRADELASADPADVIALLRPCVLSLAAQPPAPPQPEPAA
jgi:hypothetical protein